MKRLEKLCIQKNILKGGGVKMGIYLITGAAGFIGAAVAKRYLGEGHRVVTIDNLSTGFIRNIPEGCIFIDGNAFDKNVINKLEKYCFDGIFHIAGQSSGAVSYEDPIYDLNSNTSSTLLLLEYARKSKCKKFLFASSMSVYGEENECPVSENSLLKPKSFYAVGKLASEHYLRIYSSQFGLKCTSLRLNNTYGPGQNLENLKQGMVSILLAQAIKDKHIHSLGSKDRYRDFVYIDDVVDAFVKAYNGDESDNFSIYNIATNKKTTVEGLVTEIKNQLPFDVTVAYEGSTPGDQFGIYCSYDLVKEKLNWMPRVSLEIGIKLMVDWAMNFPVSI
jgi:UDP-glucose 4-epimerase